jgi:hypothetical protein
VFTCNHTASQRGESVNSSIKEKGVKKKELRSFNLFQLFEHLKAQFSRMEAKSLDSLCDLVRGNNFLTPYVKAIWEHQYQQATNLPFVKHLSNALDQWDVLESPESSIVLHHIRLKDPDMSDIPTCTCNAFLSTLIPCAGICAVFGRLQETLFSDVNLHPRWRINKHPLYTTCLKKMKLLGDGDLTSAEPTNVNGVAESQAEVDLSAYNSIVFPAKRDVRYSKFNQACKRIEGKVMDNENTYKRFLVLLAKFEQSLHDDGPTDGCVRTASSSIMAPMLPPRKRGLVSDDNNRYMSCHKQVE